MEDPDLNRAYDLRFKNPSSFLVAGATQAGKTTFTLNVLRNIDHLFEKPECKWNVYYFYREDQPGFALIAKEKIDNSDEPIVKEWFNRLPTTDDVEAIKEKSGDKGSIVIIDDFAEDLTKDTVQIFTNKVHHKNCVVIVLTQNIFCKNPVFRTISLNCTYVVMFKNPRDGSQISCFAKQFAPRAGDWVVNAYEAATRFPHSYLMFDSHQQTENVLRVRSHVLPNEFPMRVYRKKTLVKRLR